MLFFLCLSLVLRFCARTGADVTACNAKRFLIFCSVGRHKTRCGVMARRFRRNARELSRSASRSSNNRGHFGHSERANHASFHLCSL